MKFSIIIPTYNRATCVPKAITSVLEQTFDNWELIIVDDGSKDNTYEVLQRFVDDDRIRAIRQENAGVSAARNTGLRQINGDYVLFLDDDDVLMANALETLDFAARAWNAPDILCFGMENKNDLVLWKPDKTLAGNLFSNAEIKDLILPEHVNVHPQTVYFLQPFAWNKCYSTRMLINNNISFDETRRSWEDNVFLVQGLAYADSLLCIQNILYKTGDSGYGDHLSAAYSSNLLEGYMKTYFEYREQFEQRYNFENTYTNSRYFNNVCDILRNLKQKQTEDEFRNTVSGVLHNPGMKIWSKGLRTKNLNDAFLKYAAQNVNIDLFILLLGGIRGATKTVIYRLFRRNCNNT